MNISLSYSWLKEYLKIKKSPEEFAREMSMHSMTVERMRQVKIEWQKVITAKILEIRPHPNANKLRLVTVDFGSGKTQAVCGAQNIEVGQMVPFVQEGGRVLRDGHPLIVKKVNIRGVESSGMLSSQAELGIGEDHTGIFILPPDTAIGVPLEKIMPFDDVIFDIEITSNRPDCMSVLGLSREASAVFGIPLETRKQESPPTGDHAKRDKKAKKQDKKIDLRIKIIDRKLCPRYQAVVLTDVKVGASPLWLQERLLFSGIRPINTIVDITNYVMLEIGQPLHAFDYDKLSPPHTPPLPRGGRRGGLNLASAGGDYKVIEIRKAKQGESLKALDGKTYKLGSHDLVIADKIGPVALAGVMGGEESGVTKDTKTIVIESANFHPTGVRKTSRKFSLISESSNLFEKGLQGESTELAILKVIELAQKFTGAKVASKIYDVKSAVSKNPVISLDTKNLEKHLGISLSAQAAKKILQGLGCKVTGSKKMKVAIPWWRRGDLETEVDLTEEIARIYGYEKIPGQIPQGALLDRFRDPVLEWEDWCKKELSGVGFTETCTYSMISEADLKKIGMSKNDALEIYNPLSAEFQFLRPTLLPSLLRVLEKNQEREDSIKIFEIGNVYSKRKNDLPSEEPKLGIAVLGKENTFFLCKGIAEHLLKIAGIHKYTISAPAVSALWRAGGVLDVYLGNVHLGRFGELDPKLLKSFGIEKNVSCFLCDFQTFARFASKKKIFTPLPRYPSIFRDFAFVLEPRVRYHEVSEFIKNYHSLIKKVEFLSLYAGKELGGKVSLALRIEFRSDELTLKSEEAQNISLHLIEDMKRRFGAVLRS